MRPVSLLMRLCCLSFGFLLNVNTAQAQLYAASYQAEESNRPGPAPHVQHLTKELAKYLSYPPALQQQAQSSLVVVSFQLTAMGAVTKVKVHSQNEVLNRHIIQCLEGRRLGILSTPDLDSPVEYYLRLRLKQA